MAKQSTVRNGLLVAMKGLIKELFRGTRTYINSTPMIQTITITAANLATTATINGTAVTVNAGAATKTKAELATLLAAAINAASATLLVTADDDDETVRVFSATVGTSFTCVGTTNCTVDVTVSNTDYIPFGSFVAQDVDYADRCHLPNDSGDITSIKQALGIAVRTDRVENPDDYGYAVNEAVEVIRQGAVWVYVEEAVTVASDVYVRYASGAGGTVLGLFRTDDDTSTAAALPSARWLTAAGAGELALLEINLP